MLFKKNKVTICVDKEYTSDMECIINNIKSIDDIEVYVDGDKSYTSFTTKFTTNRVAEIIERRLYKSKAKHVCGIIFVEMK